LGLRDFRVRHDIRTGEGSLAKPCANLANLGEDLLVTHGAARLRLHSFSCERAYEPASDFR
jgi:hypothetical protein